jgi:hypothetical protein
MSDFKVVQLLNPIQVNTNINPTGAYNSGTTYGIGDSVSYNNNSYIAILATTGNLPSNTTYWQLLASCSTTVLGTTAKNTTGSTIPSGSVVYFSGASGNLPTLALSQANSEPTSSKTVGITATSIANNANGEVITSGLVTGLDTSAFAAGLTLWLSPTVAGGFTTTQPIAPNHSVLIGFLTRSHPTAGTIEIRIQNGSVIEDLHDVLVSSISNAQVLMYEASTLLWKNHTLVKADVGLGSVDNTSDVNKPISTATQNALNLKATIVQAAAYAYYLG